MAELIDSFGELKFMIMRSPEKLTLTQAMQVLQSAKHTINLELAVSMVRDYKRFRNKLITLKKTGGSLPADTPSLPICITYNKAAIYQLMKAPGCAAIRIYPAINSKQQLTFVIVGVDETGENIIETIGSAGSNAKNATPENNTVLDEGQTSPPYPAPRDGFK